MTLRQMSGALIVLVMAMVPLGAQTTKGQEHTIDLMTAVPVPSVNPVPQADRLSLQQPIVAQTHGREKRSVIDLLAPELDRQTYNVGESFVYEVLFENISDKPLKFPTMVGDDHVNRHAPGAALAAVALRFRDESLGEEALGLQALFGADSLPGSLVLVQPHDRVRIRAQGTWQFSRAARNPNAPKWPKSLQMRATVQLVGDGVTHFIEESKAPTAVLLRR